MPALIQRIIAWALTLKLVRTLLHYTEHRGPAWAGSITYRALFSVFAGVLLGFSMAGLWLAGNPVAWQTLIDTVDAAIPGLVGDDGLIDTAEITVPYGLTLAGVLSFIGLVGAAIGAIGSLRAALHVLADKVADDLDWWWAILRNLAIALGFGAAVGLSAAITFYGTVGLESVADWLGLAPGHPLIEIAARGLAALVVFALDTVVIAALFRLLSGMRRIPVRSLWSGALLGAVGLTVLQQLSGLFVRGAATNPLLASFASLIALLLWFNLSAQVILLASAYIVVGVAEATDRMRAKYGAGTFAQRRVRRAEDAVAVATAELDLARDAERKERTGAGQKAAKDAAKERADA
ncbi:YihY/virulence factor BrkB family protein [Microbacterium sp. BWT-B31]|uniref:YihY/virulence factor BrkB family protein n=1 Tax=Microbacterium sp. BWT-B31 TaxID=3232072 RepID=UPI0035276BC0